MAWCSSRGDDNASERCLAVILLCLWPVGHLLLRGLDTTFQPPEAYIVEIYIALCRCEDREGRQWFLQWDFVVTASPKLLLSTWKLIWGIHIDLLVKQAGEIELQWFLSYYGQAYDTAIVLHWNPET